MKLRRFSVNRLSVPLAMALAGLFTVPAAMAQTNGTWDGGGASGIWGGNNNWNPDAQIATGVGATATFANTYGTYVDPFNIIVNTARTIGNISFTGTTNDITISRSGTNVLTLSVSTGSPTVTVTNSARTLTMTTPIAGSEGMTKAGAGTLILSGTNLYTGATRINAGTLKSGVLNAIPTGSALSLGSGATVGNLDLVTFNQTVASLAVSSNASLDNTLAVGSGRTLTINGNVSVGPNTASAVTNLVASGGGNLSVSSATGAFQIGGVTGSANGSTNSVDLTGLASFTLAYGSTGTLRLGDSTNSTTGGASNLKLAANNTITVGNLRVGDSSGPNANHTLTLGSGSNVINATTTNIGTAATGIRSNGTMIFDAGDTTGTLTLRGFTGGSSSTILNMVNTSGNTGNSMSSTVNLAGHTADLNISTLTMASRSQNTGAATANLTFDQGVLAASNLVMAQRTGAGTGNATATLNLGDSVAVGVPTVTIGGLTMAENTSGGGTSTANLNISGGNVGITSINMANAAASRTATSNINLTGGTTTLAGNITRTGGAGTENATLKVSGGSLDMGGFNIGTLANPITFTAESGTLSNLATINGTGALTKTTAGTLTLTGTNTYIGGTNVNAGTLLLSGAFDMPATGTLQVNAGATFSLADGTARTTTTAALGLADGALLAFDWNGDNLDMLTSTDAATTAGTVFIGLNGTSPTGSGGTLISSPLGGLSGADYFLVNNIDYAAPLIVTDTDVSFGAISTGLTPLADAYWLGGQLTGSGLGAMALSTGGASNWATNAIGASAGGLVPSGNAVNVIFSANGATEQSLVTTGASMNLGSITFNDSTAVTIGGSHTITLNSTSATAATSSGSGTTVTPGSAISVTSSANAANAINANLTLAADQTWNIASSKTLSVGGTLGGSGGLTLGDAGTLVLSGSNSYTGATAINDGNVTLSGSGTLGTGSALTLGGGYLDLGSTSQTVGAVSVTAPAASGDTILNGSITGTSYAASNASGNAVISANLLGAGAFTKSGAGTATLSGANTYTGNTTVQFGTLNLTGSLTGNGTATTGPNLLYGTTAGNSVVNVSGDIVNYLRFQGATDASANAAYIQTAGNANFTTTQVGNPTSILAAAGYGYMSLTGGTLKANGRFGPSNGSATTGVMYIGGTGTFDHTGGEWLLMSHSPSAAAGAGRSMITVDTGGTLDRVGAGNNFGLNMDRSGGYAVLNIVGGSVLNSNRAITFGNGTGANITNTSGFINLAAGTLQIGTNIANGNTGSGSTGNNAYLNFAGGTLKAQALLTNAIPVTAANQTFTSTLYGPIDNDGSSHDFVGGLTVDTNDFATTLANNLVAPSADGVAQSSLTITGGSDYIGAPMVQFTGGTLAPGGAPAAGYAVVSGGAVTGIVITAPGSYSSAPSVTLTGGGGSGADVTVGALVPNTGGGLTKTGLGTLTLSGANTYTGPTLVTDGTLQLNGAAATTPATSGVTVNTGGTLGFTTGSASSLDLTGKPLTLGGGTLAFGIGSTGINDSITVNDFTLTADSSISINAVGALASGEIYTVLTSANPISAGSFSLSGTPVGRLSVTPTINTNTVTITPTLFEGIWNLSAGGVWSNGDPTMTAGNWTNYKPSAAGDAALFGSAIAAPSTIDVDAAHILGYVRFDNSSAYTIGSNASSNLTLDNGAASALVAVTSGSHVIAENVALASNLIVAPVTGTTLTISGNLTGTGTALQKFEGGTLELSGTDNGYIGDTTVSAGTLSLTGSLTGGGAITVDGTGVLDQSATGIISGASSLVHSSSGTSTLAGANTSTGAITVTNGQLNISNRGAGNMGTVLVSSGGILEFSGSATYSTTQMSVGATSATTGTVNQTGGTVSFPSGNALLLGTGVGVGSTGIYNLSGGTLTSFSSANRGVMLGANNGNTATFNLSGTGNLSLASAILMIGRSDIAQAGCTALFNQTGGTATVNALTIGGTGTGTATGTMTLSAGTFVANTFTKLALAENDVTTINIGGTADVTLPAFPTVRGSGATATINFDGGTLRPAAASTAYMGGLTNAFIKAGGATFNTTGFDITITQDLLTDAVSTGGGLTKAGTNALTLAGTNTFTGGSTIAGGVLGVTNANALGDGDVTFNGGASLRVAAGLDVANDITIGTNTGISGRGLVEAGATAGTSTVSGAITINNAALAGGHFSAPTANTTLHVAGPITSSVQVSQRVGTVRYSGGGTGYSAMVATGTTIVGTNDGIATTATVTLGGSAACTLDLNGFNQSLAGIIKGGSAATIGNSSTTDDSTLTTTGTSSYAGVIQDVVSPGTRKVNLAVPSGSLTLTGTNTFSGDITVENGTLIGAGATNSPGITVFGSRSNTRTITVNNGGTLQFNSGNILGAGHTATTAPTLVINSGGVVTNGGTATNNALNNVQLNGGILTSTTGHTSSSPPNAPVYGAWNLNGSVTSTGTSTISTSDPTKGWIMLKVPGDKTTDFNVTSGTLTVSAPVVDNPTDGNIGSLSKSGAGAMILAAANTYTGNTIVSDGALTLADDAQLKFVTGATSGISNSVTGTGSLTVDGDFIIDTTLTDASALTAGSWTLVDASTLTESFSSSFTIPGWSEAGNVWTKTVGSKKYTFDETTGVLTLGPSASYASWIAGFPGVGLLDGVDDDPDFDGIPNAVEMVLGGDPATGMDTALLPTLELVTNPVGDPATIPAGDYLLFTFRRTDLSDAAGVTADCETSTSLAAPWTAATVTPGVVIQVDDNFTFTPPAAADTDRVRVYVPRGANTKLFGRLNVEVP